MTRIIVTGASGRMGRMLVRAVTESEGAELVGATERPGSGFVGGDAGNVAGIGALGITLVDDISTLPQADVLIDFTTPEACMEHAEFVAKHGMRMVVGTTGHSVEQLQDMRNTLIECPAVIAANYSVGVNLALQLIRQASQVLGPDYDAEIFEAHHKHKKDAPSGTALAMGRTIAWGRGTDFDKVAVFSREGITGERESGSIGFSVMRAGNLVGEHKAMFVSDEERIEIGHVATDRMVFAKGAVRAAHWLMDQRAGWYGMEHVLGLGG